MIFSIVYTVRENGSEFVREGRLLVNKIDVAKLNLPPQCTKIISFSSLAQPEVGAAYVTAGT